MYLTCQSTRILINLFILLNILILKIKCFRCKDMDMFNSAQRGINISECISEQYRMDGDWYLKLSA